MWRNNRPCIWWRCITGESTKHSQGFRVPKWDHIRQCIPVMPAPVCISVARNEVDSTYSIAVKLVGNISRGSGCLYSIYYGDRCSISSSEYVGLTTDYYALYAAICPGLVVDNYYVSQGTGRGCTLTIARD